MTSDAKIGLLLGLVFIFVIAFVINGLPNLRPPIGKVEATTLTGEDFGASGITGQADKGFDWPAAVDPPRADDKTARTAVEETRPVVQELPQAAPPQTANDESIRYLLPLPRFEGLIERLTPTISQDRTDTISLGAPKPATEPAGGGSRPPVATAVQPQSDPRPQPNSEARTEPRAESKPVDATRVAGTPELPKPVAPAGKPAVISGSKLYTVVEGDNLPAIAKKMYGPEEGNRFVNIDRIFQANQLVLKDPAQVFVGQKLIIPPLPKPTATAPAPAPAVKRPEDVLPKALFEKPKTVSEKVDAWGKRIAAAVPAPTPEGRWYTVQNGDNLWKIAASQLGSGARCEEIAKLNADIIASPDTLDVGVRLRLPAK